MISDIVVTLEVEAEVVQEVAGEMKAGTEGASLKENATLCETEETIEGLRRRFEMIETVIEIGEGNGKAPLGVVDLLPNLGRGRQTTTPET